MLKPEIKFTPKEIKYDHGFSEEEVFRITEEYKRLQEKVSSGERLTLSEQEIVFKHFRISRTEAFVLQELKVKPEKPEKIPKQKVEKIPKPKKQTKKQIKERLEFLIDKNFTEGLSEEETEELQTLAAKK